jgi:2-oxoisovalerate dehydrogenase E1 component
VREGRVPVLLRLTVPRLSGHSGQDTQAYKSPEVVALERARDPLGKLHGYLVPGVLSESEWNRVAARRVRCGDCDRAGARASLARSAGGDSLCVL